MATRRRIGVSAASTEAARRQLMQPVPCWEKVWITPTSSSNGTLKVYKWVKTEKLQQFSDDEGEADEPLAPLPDEPEVVEGDDDMDQDEAASAVPMEATQQDNADADVAATQEDIASKPPSPKPQLSISLQPTSDLNVDSVGDELDASLKPLDADLVVGVNVEKTPDDGIELDISALGPDGLGLEASHDLSQMEGVDVLIGGAMMDQSGDPFAEPTTSDS